MKNISYLSAMLFAGLSIISCKKDNGNNDTAASLNIVNASIFAPTAAINFSANGIPYFQNKTFIGYQSAQEFGVASGSNQLNIVSSADTTTNLLRATLSLKTGGIYSLYIAGTAAKTDTVFMKDNIPFFAADSVAGVRFINLCPDSQPLNIILQGGTSSQFNNLAYKKITAFTKYSAISNIINNGGYIFNITDAEGNVLTSFNWVPNTFKSNTLVISGSISEGSLSVFQVNNY